MESVGRIRMREEVRAALDVASAVLLAAFVVAVPLDARAADLVQAGALGACVLAVAHLLAHGDVVSWKRLALLLGAWGVVTWMGVRAGGTAGPTDFAERQHLLAGAMTLGGVVLAEVALARLDRAGGGRAARTLVLGLVVLFLWQYASCFVSRTPWLSFLSFASGGAGPQFMACGLFGVLLTRRDAGRHLMRTLAGSGAVVLVLALVVSALALAGGDTMIFRLEDLGALRDPAPGRRAFSFTLQFPFFLHNRLGYYALVAGFACLVAGAGWGRRWAWRAGVAMFLACVVVILLSKTRGAMAGAGAGLLVYVLAARQVRAAGRVALAAGAILMGMLTAAVPLRESLREVTTPSRIIDPASTASLRVHAIHAATDMARRHPWTGIGHGPHVFWQVYTTEYQAGLGDPEMKEHPYNSYLELLAGSGTVALLAFLTVLGVAAGRLLVVRNMVAEAPAALGLLAAVAVFAGTNTIVQGALGGVVWLVVLACGVLGAEAVSRPSRADGA
jgi:hypothetical protein